MYSDRVVAGAKRPISERLNGEFDAGRFRSFDGKRQRTGDEKWKHDLYKGGEGTRASEPKVGPRDLRLKLQRKELQQSVKSGRDLGVRDLREKLSGIVQPVQPQLKLQTQPKNVELQKIKVVTEKAKATKKTPPAETPLSETKQPPEADSSRKTSQQKPGTSVDSLLQSLGLEKYSITFQAEEIDMAALRHMADEDLKSLGIPMGPRKKILLALKTKPQG